MEVAIISKECIKPSSPTPLHLKTHKISLLDQFHDHFYGPEILYYPLNQYTNLSSSIDIDHIVSQRLQLLKQSLSKTLVSFYPLAGKIKDYLSVDCNDEGIYFVEARVKKTLNEFLNKLDLPLILKFLPVVGNEQSGHIAGAHVAKIQLTFFSCGGLVICACISHRVGDAATLGSFLKNWASTASKKTEETLCPNYDASSLFPQNDAYPREATWMALGSPFYRTGKFVVRRFVFDAEAIGDLKAKATSSSMQNPTRVEAVSALLSKCIMAAVKSKSGSHKPTLLSHLVNLRRKSKLQSLDGSMGNIIWFANAMCMDEEVELGDLVCKLREATTKVNGDFVESLQGGEGFLNLCKAINDEKEACDDAKERITFSSLCNFGLYNVDFGWGKPIWVSCAVLDGSITCFSSNIVLMDTRLGSGIEAWLFLLEEDMDLLELDKELLAFASLDPSPLIK